MAKFMKLKKGDTVKILIGKDKGKTGKILNVMPKEGKVTIEGLNLYKKHAKPKKQGEKGEIITLPRAINSSNAMIICPNCKSAARIGYVVEGDDKKRICKKCQARI